MKILDRVIQNYKSKQAMNQIIVSIFLVAIDSLSSIPLDSTLIFNYVKVLELKSIQTWKILQHNSPKNGDFLPVFQQNITIQSESSAV